jgi:hypothetical protein
VVREAVCLAEIKVAMHARAAEVGIDEQHVVTFLGTDVGEVGHGGEFTLASAASDYGESVRIR